jgi:ABC-2 type transport system ATP-binding protein
VVYLDEPTIGLDLLVKERIRTFIRDQNTQKGSTVVLTTHDLGDIEELCSRVIIIDNGELIYDGPLSLIKDRFGKFRQISFDTTGFEGTVTLPAGAQLINQGECSLVVRFDRTVASASQVASAVMAQVDVRDFSLSEPGLAMIIKQIYQGALDKTEADSL